MRHAVLNAACVCLLAGSFAVGRAEAQQPTLGDLARDQLDARLPAVEAEVLPAGAPFAARFTSDVDGLRSGSPVTIGGFRVGTVREVTARLPEDGTTLSTDVTFDVVAARLRLGDRPLVDETALVDAVAALVNRGLRVEVDRPLAGLGQPSLKLAFVEDAAPAGLDRSGAVPQIPAGPDQAARLAAIQEQLLVRLETLPIEELADDLVATMQTLRTSADDLPATLDRLATRIEGTIDRFENLIAGELTEEMLTALRETTLALREGVDDLVVEGGAVLSEVRSVARSTGSAVDQAAATAAGLERSIGGGAPLWRDIDDLLAETTELVRSLRLFISYLERHPEALLTGKPG